MEENKETRGKRKVLAGVVVSDKGNKTCVVEVERLVRHGLYSKTLKRAAKYHAHDEGNEAKIGDKVEIMSTRPISKMKRWRVSKIVDKAIN
ncbi:small subunit ribosomal protein S17 [Elusimicrobium simillimum]|uniref:30S ribosomal protein S17 n=1 Tax=Elusimicrobium simillimum TaxID=3143438 RepID=UPI003C6F4687